jgi:hypothetical protein
VSYESPISVILAEISSRIEEAEEDQILRVVHGMGVKVDKEELLKALEYDRDQYEKGRWDMFQTITDAWFGKRFYFLQGEKVYSKLSKKLVTKEGAYKEICLLISMREEEE